VTFLLVSGTPMMSHYALMLALRCRIVGLLVKEASKVRRPFARDSLFSQDHYRNHHHRRTQHLPFVGRDRREITLTVEATLAFAEVHRDA
jgi:hypothetical protein